ncbi:MAG: hypothetical protein HQM03_18020 [Magnetococcales bacterium]|nr:hypothetical protein [Magnetococcales bacterium]
MNAHLSEDGTILHIHIPMQLRRRGGRKVILTPDGHPAAPPAASNNAMPDDPLVRALVKARRWQGLLESGEVATIKELAEKEGVEKSYLAKLLKLNILAPAIVEAILRGDYPDSLSLEKLRAGVPLEWEEQGDLFGMQVS